MSELLAAAVDTLSVHSAHSFTIFGFRHEVPHEDAELGDSVLSGSARALLADILYSRLHCRQVSPASNAPGGWVEAREFIHALSAANRGNGGWQPGWIIRNVEGDGEVVAEKYGIRFWIPSVDFRADADPAGVGDRGYARVPKECCHLLPGFYLALGDAADAATAEHETVRVYWHLWSGGAAPLVRLLTGILNRLGVPFQLKLLARPEAYPRSDAAVLYLSPDGYNRLIPFLGGVYREIQTSLRPSVSLFAKQIAPGVGLAEDPSDGSSFGQHRCELVVAELTRTGIPSAGSGAERCRMLLSALGQLGWDPERLYLNPGSRDRYPILSPEELRGNG